MADDYEPNIEENDELYDEAAQKRRPAFEAVALRLYTLALCIALIAALLLHVTAQPVQLTIDNGAEGLTPDGAGDKTAPEEQTLTLQEEIPSQQDGGEPEGQSAGGAVVYVKTAVTVKGKTIGVLASYEAADDLLNEVLYHYRAIVAEEAETAIADIAAEFDTDVPVALVSAAETAELTSADELFSTLTARNTPLSVICRISTRETAIKKAGTVSTNDKYLPVDTRIVDSLGRDGEQVTITERIYKNGAYRTTRTLEPEVASGAVDTVIRTGTLKHTDSAPGKNQGKEGPETNIIFVSPTSAKIKDNYGMRYSAMHYGMDFAADAGTEVRAAAAGTVVCVMQRGAYGLLIEIDHGEGFLTRYAHLASAAVQLGDTVYLGQAIGVMGLSGTPDAEGDAVLHFELRIGGEAYNPRYYIDF